MDNQKLTDAEVAHKLSARPGWNLDSGQLSKTFEFTTYASGAVFAAAVAHVADRMDHHPDLLLGYRKLKVSVSTHSVGGISPLDFRLAEKIDAIA